MFVVCLVLFVCVGCLFCVVVVSFLFFVVYFVLCCTSGNAALGDLPVSYYLLFSKEFEL